MTSRGKGSVGARARGTGNEFEAAFQQRLPLIHKMRLDGVALLAGFKLPEFNLFDGNGDPLKLLKWFIAHMTITSNNPNVYMELPLSRLTHIKRQRTSL
ncbi:hypothetical protein LIER_15361 [Lithospermum erythrorhizon]|uniref:Uncharacterized protein n=1 Tax=Lithospermum erythrorhizon TaxID=34254 RepID=A0AAV3Q5Q8_LITER